MKPIKFYNVDRFYECHREQVLRLTDEVFSSGHVVEGEYLQKAESRVADLCARKYAVAVGSCTDALYFALLAAGIKAGDEVLVPAFSFIASASVVVRVGAIPVFVDVDKEGQIDIDDAKEKITKKTRAVLFVHLYGRVHYPASLVRLAENHNLVLIEDAAQALGSSRGHVRAGSLGLASGISFDPSKIVHAFGTGGMLLTDDENIAGLARQYRAQGRKSGTNDFAVQGYNSRLSTLQAALLCLQLDELNRIIEKRIEIADYYYSRLGQLSQLRLIYREKEEVWNYHKFPLFTLKRDELKAFLGEQGIETGIHYSKILPAHSLFNSGNFQYPKASGLSEITLSLPIYPELSEHELVYICDSVVDFLKNS